MCAWDPKTRTSTCCHALTDERSVSRTLIGSMRGMAQSRTRIAQIGNIVGSGGVYTHEVYCQTGGDHP